MIELDPEILKRSLPPNIYGTIDQVTANVNHAVDEIIKGFTAKAEEAVKQFEARDFPQKLRNDLDQINKAFTDDLNAWQKNIQDMTTAANNARKIAAAANVAALNEAVDAMETQAKALNDKLDDFRKKANTFAETSGSFIASAAVKMVTSGV
jgi:polyhydroxyalkanoate synthesis regulator phasin